MGCKLAISRVGKTQGAKAKESTRLSGTTWKKHIRSDTKAHYRCEREGVEFAVCGQTDYGTLSVANIENLPVGQRAKINAVFTPSGVYEPIAYTFEGNDIEISNGYITAINPDKTVAIFAKTRYHEVMFTVTTVRLVSITRNVTAWIGYPASSLADISYRGYQRHDFVDWEQYAETFLRQTAPKNLRYAVDWFYRERR